EGGAGSQPRGRRQLDTGRAGPGDPKALAGPAADARLSLGGGRQLPKLLFVTCRPRLEANIGGAEADRVVTALSDANMPVADLPDTATTAEAAAAAVRPSLADATIAGAVILGGYDVVPPYRLDLLDAATRASLET